MQVARVTDDAFATCTLSFSHKHHRLFGFILSLLISIATCAYVLLSWYALRGRRRALPPAPPHPLLFFNGLPLLPTHFLFFISIIGYPCYLHPFLFSKASSVIWVHFIFIDIHRHLCLCTSLLVRIAGGGAALLFFIL